MHIAPTLGGVDQISHLRASSYVIRVELANGRTALAHGYTGAFDLVDPDVVALLDSVGDSDSCTGDGDDVRQALVRALVSRGYLTDLTEEDEMRYVGRLARALHEIQLDAPAFVIVPSYSCNLSCVYCFQSSRQRSSGTTMTLETVERCFAAIDTLSRGKTPRQEIDLFGGEPMARENLTVVEAIVAEGRRRGYTFAAVTNGYDLAAFEHLLGEPGIRSVQVTLDGPAPVHDRRRRSREFSPSFATIMRNLERAVAIPDLAISVRVNVDRTNIESCLGLFAEFLERGWDCREGFLAYANVVYRRGCRGCVDSDFSNAQLIAELGPALRHLSRSFHASALKVNILARLLPALKEDRVPAMRPSFCAAHTGMYIFCPDGQVFPCWESLGRDGAELGRFAPSLTLDAARLDTWRSRTAITIEECLACPYVFYCGGGCAQHALYNHGTMARPECQDFPAAFADALATALELVGVAGVASSGRP